MTLMRAWRQLPLGAGRGSSPVAALLSALEICLIQLESRPCKTHMGARTLLFPPWATSAMLLVMSGALRPSECANSCRRKGRGKRRDRGLDVSFASSLSVVSLRASFSLTERRTPIAPLAPAPCGARTPKTTQSTLDAAPPLRNKREDRVSK